MTMANLNIYGVDFKFTIVNKYINSSLDEDYSPKANFESESKIKGSAEFNSRLQWIHFRVTRCSVMPRSDKNPVFSSNSQLYLHFIEIVVVKL